MVLGKAIRIAKKKGRVVMTSKERAYLRGLANQVPSLYQVGKDGITQNMIKQIDDALEARELIKGNVL
jgi:RNA-binding protein